LDFSGWGALFLAAAATAYNSGYKDQYQDDRQQSRPGG
jgi:hypothetical protein